MQQFVHVYASVYNKSLIAQSITKQELSKNQLLQNPLFPISSLKKELNKKLFAKAESIVNKILSRPCLKLPNSQTLILDDIETGNLLSDFAQQLRHKNA